MKTIVLAILLAISNFIVQAQDSKGVNITINISNVKNDNGFVILGLHNQETFMAKGKSALKRIKREIKNGKIKNGKIKVTFDNVQEGNYAIMVIHDENANNQMDFELNGMPKEAYGISNNNISFGPPIFEDAKFKVEKENLSLEIRL